ncbi:conserved hypothetical protein [Vibrio crassostreae]|uniref:Uncharacterized protein n=1 Tax=Vibrio crassostreae TaxID=246167 RepID=A0A822MQZ0_9VIBR|nr:conserved hypothetical protein [Vibrio crassostreae]CAK1914842.1 conserved hypothetical protein [Vibrio crassostreae]CAK1937055.1 conserved hypothetical protein [Vibrio crassostreae]CAK1938257.1 conserved hypothetical protein [Vibrio crassostreae]CAK1945714.1 conserved hypothetical protein [Vibrio crassostreae]
MITGSSYPQGVVGNLLETWGENGINKPLVEISPLNLFFQ